MWKHLDNIWLVFDYIPGTILAPRGEVKIADITELNSERGAENGDKK